MVTEEEKPEEPLEKYVKLSVEELTTLRDSYKVKIKSKAENHWLTRLERRTRYNVSNFLILLTTILGAIGILSITALLLLTIFNKNALLEGSWMFWLFMSMTFSFVGLAIMKQAMDDGTGQDRRLLRNIELILDKKEYSPKKIMFDSNIFDDFESGKIKLGDIDKAKSKGYKFYITSVQNKEINDIPDEKKEKREKLMNFIVKLQPEIVSTESTSIGVSVLGLSKLSDGDLIKQFDNDNPKKRKDALIGETALKNDYVLVTHDKELSDKIHQLGGRSYSLEDFLKKINT